MDAMIRLYKFNYFLSLHAAAVACGGIALIRYNEQKYSPALYLGILAGLLLLVLSVWWLKILFPTSKSTGALNWIDDSTRRQF
jgi:hypothetical protein